ncbi:hypothetical protein chiPu_0019747 [Chiloscyllium punctatum]|uniref:Potassium channel domain-containing protein n=1 Tax=Chiloscyllium punctatum TaxID=137246 RepID=A0A401RT25_CHIPU|nr:hypothetical protein [Chiloscyllium punctatum]
MAEHRPRCDLKACYFLKLTLCFLVYVLFGMVVFSAIEQPWEVQMRKELVEMKSTFLQQHGCIPEPELDALLHRVITASNYGVSALRNASDDRNWDLASSLFFVSTVLTTIGYGHSVPFTSGGKAFCMLYSVLGIPITLLLLTSVVQHLMFYVHWVPITYIHTHWRLAMPVVARIHALVIGSVVAGCFFLIPAAAFTALEEDWDYVSSLYFCFVSLSTIGLGDYVPGNSRYPSLRNLYKVGIALMVPPLTSLTTEPICGGDLLGCKLASRTTTNMPKQTPQQAGGGQREHRQPADNKVLRTQVRILKGEAVSSLERGVEVQYRGAQFRSDPKFNSIEGLDDSVPGMGATSSEGDL